MSGGVTKEMMDGLPVFARSIISDQDKEISSLKEKVKVFEQENAHLRKVNGIKLKRTTIKQSLVYANDALEKECTRVKELEAISETYSNEWDACKKQASTLAEKVEQKDAKIRELETELMHKGRSYPVIKFSEISSLQAQIALLRRGLEDIGKILDKGGWSRVAEMIVAQTLSSSPSEFLEAVREIIEEIEVMKNPYPEDIFKEPTHEQYLEFNKHLEQFGLAPDAYNGSTGRRVWNFLHDNTLEALSKLSRFV